MLKIVNPELFSTVVTERDTSKDKYPGGSIQEDIFMKSGKDSQETRSPIVRCFLDDKTEASDLSGTPTRIRSIIKKTSTGKNVIQVKVTKSAKKLDTAAAVIALPFKGTISGFVYGQGVKLLKAVVRNVDQFKHNGEKYSKILYLVMTTDGTADPLVEKAPDVTVFVRTVSGPKQPHRGAKYSVQTNRYCVFDAVSGSFEHAVEPKVECVGGETMVDLTYEQFKAEAPLIKFGDLVNDICMGNAEDCRGQSTSKTN